MANGKYVKDNESFKEKRKRILEEEINSRREELEKLSIVEEVPVIELSDYTTEDKVKFFDKMYQLSLDTLTRAEESGYKSEDTDYWFFEQGFTILNLKNTKKLWEYYNKINR